uniref:Transcription elongation factor GreA n=1 Tax=candidate division WOR-3 bacterium TaxID=2052148 RepID=A0A7V3PTG5_UNCW3
MLTFLKCWLRFVGKMSDELIRLFRTQLGKKQFSELEGTWLELLSTGIPLKELLALIDLVLRWATPELARTLLWVLADFLAEQQRYAEQLIILRRLVPLIPDDEKLTREISLCLHKLYPDEPLLARLLPKSGLGYGEPLTEALNRLDRYLHLLPGKLIYDHQEGTGKVKNLDLLFDRVTITFDNGKELTLDIQTAANRFRFPAPGSFFYLLKTDPQELQQLLKQDPSSLIILYLKDIGKPVTKDEIMKTLAPVIGSEQAPEFWEKAKKGLSKHPQITISARPPRTYSWHDLPLEKTSQPDQGFGQKTTITTHLRQPATEKQLNPATISHLTPEQILDIFSKLRTVTERKELLNLIMQTRTADWQEIYTRIFLTGPDRRTAQLIKDRLPEDKWQALLARVVTDYRTYPNAFLLVAEEINSGSYLQIIHRLLDIMETDPDRTRRNQAKKILIKDNYQLLRNATNELSQTAQTSEEKHNDARRLLERIKANRLLEPFHQEQLLALVADSTGQIKQTLITANGSDPTAIIWTSAAGLERANAELRQLMDEELPRSAEEIARARAFGDLSENYEYKAAREKQARVMQKINRLRTELSCARVIEPEKIDTNVVQVGCRVQLAADDGTFFEFTILGPWDADYEHGIISFQSPLAQKILGMKPGDTVQFDNKTLKLTKIMRAL